MEVLWKDTVIDSGLGVPVVSGSPGCWPLVADTVIVGRHVERGASKRDQLVEEVRGPRGQKWLEMLGKLLPVQIYPVQKKYHHRV